MQTLGQRLRAAREAKQISQQELARRAGVSSGAIGNLEAGSRKSPRNLLAIAAALGVSPHWLETGVGSMSDFVLVAEPGTFSRLGNSPDISLKLDKRTVPVTRSRVEIMTGAAGDVYAFVLDDDALAPDYPRGTELVFDVAKKPAPGSVVLVVDGQSNLQAREFRQAANGWVASSINRAYASFDGSTVRLLATARYRAMP